MNRPRIFLSAVSGNPHRPPIGGRHRFRTLWVRSCLSRRFPTGCRRVAWWLREQVDSCEGLIQLIGRPMELNRPTWTRTMAVSPYPVRIFYAKRGKKTWVIVIGENLVRQTNRGTGSAIGPIISDPFATKIGGARSSRITSAAFCCRIATLIYHRNIILHLRDDLGELRRTGYEGTPTHQGGLMSRIRLGLAILRLAAGGLSATTGWSATSRLVPDATFCTRPPEETHRRELAEARNLDRLEKAAGVARSSRHCTPLGAGPASRSQPTRFAEIGAAAPARTFFRR